MLLFHNLFNKKSLTSISSRNTSFLSFATTGLLLLEKIQKVIFFSINVLQLLDIFATYRHIHTFWASQTFAHMRQNLIPFSPFLFWLVAESWQIPSWVYETHLYQTLSELTPSYPLYWR